MIERHDEQIWAILDEVIKDKTVFLNRAPTLHRLSIQAFEPVLVEGKAIRLHPMVCTPFNADFDGDQMAVHVPLSIEAQLESRLMMLASTSIFSPASGKSIMTPTQDVCLGIYYITTASQQDKLAGKLAGKSPAGDEHLPLFNDIGEVEFGIAEKAINYQSRIRFRNPDFGSKGRPHGESAKRVIETTAGRVVFNSIWPKEMGFVNDKVNKSTLGNLILDCHRVAGHDRTVHALDDLKSLGYKHATLAGVSMGLKDMIRPKVKADIIAKARVEAEKVQAQFQQGIITDGERHNKIVDIWSAATEKVSDELYKTIDRNITPENPKPIETNPVYMMVDSKARGSKLQIRQLAGMRGLMSNPSGEIIERPITASFREGLSVLEYFISTHGARSGLADTALKTADAGYLTRRLVDVAHDVIITEEDCGTLRGLPTTALKKGEDIVVSLAEKILGRTSVHDIYDPHTDELIASAGEELTEAICKRIEDAGIEEIEIRSVLTCESKHGVCAKCYGRNLATGKMVQKGEAVGVIAAQAIGEPGTQLTLRTFHVGGVAGGNIGTTSSLQAKHEGRLEIDELRAIPYTDEEGSNYNIVIGRSAEMRVVDEKTDVTLSSALIPYGAKLYKASGETLRKGDLIAEWDTYNAVIISDVAGKVSFENVIENVTYRVESDAQTGLQDKVVIESRQRTKNPTLNIIDGEGNILKVYDLPVGAHIGVEQGQNLRAGDIMVKIPRSFGKAGDITGGLPRVTELFEARNPSDPAVVAEIDGIVSISKKLKRNNREITITSKTNETRSYLISTSKQILAQDNDYVKAGTPLCEGAITPADILAVKGPMKVQEYIVNEVQEVYRLQGVKINDKHFEIIVRQMMRKVEIEDPGDTHFLQGELVNKIDFHETNDEIFGMKVVEDKGESEGVEKGQIITARKLRDENSLLRRRDMKLITAREAKPATAKQILQGITRASLQTKSFISAASFQETTKVLTEAAINAKQDFLEGMKENVIVGHLIPAGTGLREYQKLIVGNREEVEEAERQVQQPMSFRR